MADPRTQHHTLLLSAAGKMKVGSGTWGEAGAIPWALATAGLSACLGSFHRLVCALVNVLPGWEPALSHPPGKHLCEKAVPRGRASAAKVAPVLPALSSTEENKEKRETC